MVDFVQRNFRRCFPVILWIILIGCIISGMTTGWNSGKLLGFFSIRVHPFVGAILGGTLMGLFGLIIIILVGGIFATILKMADDIEQLKTSSSSSGRNLSGSNLENISPLVNKRTKKCSRCKKEVDENYTGCPHCGNNTFE